MDFTGAVLVNTNHPLQFIENIQVPKLKRGQVLVKVSYAGICHSQLMDQSGQRGEDKYLPHLLGHQGTGMVVDVGPGVTNRIVLGWLKGEGLDAGGIVKNQVKPKAEDILGFVGLGGIGMSPLIAATCLPHELLIAIGNNEEKLALAKQLGADVCLNPEQQDILTEIVIITNGSMLDFPVEAAGSCKTIELAFDLIISQQCQCIFASHPPAGQKIQIDSFELISGKTITGSLGGCYHPEHMASFISDNKTNISFDSFMSNIYSFRSINTAMRDLSNQKVPRAPRAIVEVNSL